MELMSKFSGTLRNCVSYVVQHDFSWIH